MEVIRKADVDIVRENLALKQELRRTQAQLDQAEATAAEYKRLAKSYRRRNIARYGRQIDRREQRLDILTDIMLAIPCAGLMWLMIAAIGLVFKAVALS